MKIPARSISLRPFCKPLNDKQQVYILRINLMQQDMGYKMLARRQVYNISCIICSAQTDGNNMMPFYSWRFSLEKLKRMFTSFSNQLIINVLVVHVFIYY